MKKKRNKFKDFKRKNRHLFISIIVITLFLILVYGFYHFKLSGYVTGPGGITINFIYPTPINGYKTNQQTFTVSMSSSDTSPANGEHSTFLDYDRSLFAWYRFSNLTDFLDHSTYTNDGVNKGTIFSSTGKRGGGRFFNGSAQINGDNYIIIGNGNEFNTVCLNGCTFSAFVYPQATHGTIIARSDSTNSNEFFKLNIDGSGRSNFLLSNNGINKNCSIAVSGDNPALNAWHHIVGVYDSVNDEIKVYQNGSLKQTLKCSFTSLNLTAWSDSENTFIGIHDDSSWRDEFQGTIDEVLVFNKALSANEIKSIYDARTTQYSQTFSNVQNGVHTYTSYIVDASGNIASETRSIIIDTNYVPSVCPNNVKEGNEVCDGTDLAGKTCLNFNYTGGILKCKSDCLGYDTSMCTSSTPSLNLVVNIKSDDTISDLIATDSSTYANNGICVSTNCPTYNSTGGIVNSGVYNYSNDVVSLPTSSSLQFGTGGFSFSGWINPTTASDFRIANKRGRGTSIPGWQLKINSDAAGKWGFFDTFVSDGTDILGCSSGFCGDTTKRWNLNELKHVVVTFQNSYPTGTDNLTIYVNGVSVYTLTGTNIENINTSTTIPTEIGGTRYANGVLSTIGQAVAGKIDEVKIYNKVLSTTEILNLYNEGLSATQCSDTIDNDADSFIDMGDAGCTSTSDNDENNCGNAICEFGETTSCPGDCGTPPPTLGTCGNAIKNIGEQCDDGGGNGYCPSTCSSTCTFNSCSASGNIHFVRDGSGVTTNCGSNWNTACDDLNNFASLQRNHTYYIADGKYSSYNFDDAVSGTQYIYVKKATGNNPQVNSTLGWQSSFGDGFANFTPTMKISSNYWVIDGMTGGGPANWKSGYGFIIQMNKITYFNSLCRGNIIKAFSSAGTASFVRVSHFNIEGGGIDGDGTGYYYGVTPPKYCVNATANDLFYLTGGIKNNWTLSYNYLHDSGRTILIGRQLSDTLFEYNYFSHVESHTDQHSETTSIYIAPSDRNIYRYNVFDDAAGTCVVCTGNAYGTQLYGNIVFDTENLFLYSAGKGTRGNAVFGDWRNEQTTNARVYNNVFYNLKGDNNAVAYNGLGALAYNNIYYNPRATSLANWKQTTHNYNSFFNAGGPYGETNEQVASGNPFTNGTNIDFSLKDPNLVIVGRIENWMNNRDMLGNVRGADGKWDRGAIEYKI